MKHGAAKHLKPKLRNVDNIFDPQQRYHDTDIIDNTLPVETAEMIMLDLGLDYRSASSKRVLVVSSPLRKCVETATVVAQTFGVEGIFVHYGFCQSMMASLDNGWDWATMPLVASQSEMREIVRQKSLELKSKDRGDVRLMGFIGKSFVTEDKNESEREYVDRVEGAIEDMKSSLFQPGDHAIVIAHDETLKIIIHHYGSGSELISNDECSYLTLAVASPRSAWIASRCRLQLSPQK